LRQAQYHLKTKLGLSDEFYSNLDSALHGTGQGSKASPVIWAAISSVILILIQQQSEGVTMVDPEGIEHLLLLVPIAHTTISFVDPPAQNIFLHYPVMNDGWICR
jgi:hypothetical protein